MPFPSLLEMRNYRLGSVKDRLQNHVYDAVEFMISQFHYGLGYAPPCVVHLDIYVAVFFQSEVAQVLNVSSAGNVGNYWGRF